MLHIPNLISIAVLGKDGAQILQVLKVQPSSRHMRKRARSVSTGDPSRELGIFGGFSGAEPFGT